MSIDYFSSGPGPRQDKVEGSAPITVDDNVWISGRAIRCPGVSIDQVPTGE